MVAILHELLECDSTFARVTILLHNGQVRTVLPIALFMMSVTGRIVELSVA